MSGDEVPRRVDWLRVAVYGSLALWTVVVGWLAIELLRALLSLFG